MPCSVKPSGYGAVLCVEASVISLTYTGLSTDTPKARCRASLLKTAASGSVLRMVPSLLRLLKLKAKRSVLVMVGGALSSLAPKSATSFSLLTTAWPSAAKPALSATACWLTLACSRAADSLACSAAMCCSICRMESA